MGCGKEEVWVCEECFKQIDAKGVFSCKNGYLDSVQSIVAYEEDGLIGKIIRGFKYNYAEELKSVIEKIIKIFLLSHEGIFSGLKAIVPIPLHPRRYAERGFNQAEVIAKILSAEMNIPCQVLLKRQKYTKQQVKLSKEERKINVDNAFSALEKLSGAILLVDDVFTTGATMQEGARILKSAGAEKVLGFTLARG